MDILCPQCSQKHDVSDIETAGKKIYFFCTSCGHKISVDNRKNMPASDSLNIKHVFSSNSISDILTSVYYFFNIKGFFISFIYIVLAVFLFACTLVFFLYFPDITLNIKLFVSIFLFSILYYGNAITLYLLSKNHYHATGELPNSNQTSNLANDLLTLLLSSVGILFITAFLLIPVYIFKEYGLLYGGLFLPILFTPFFAIFLSFLMNNYFPAYLALHSLSTITAIKSFFSFIRKEIVALPFHYAASFLVFSFYNGIILFVFYTVFSLTLFGIVHSLNIPIDTFQSFTSSASISSLITAVSANIISYGKPFLFFSSIILLSFLSFSFNSLQTVFSRSYAILKNNPENSVSKRAILFFLIISAGIIGCLFFYTIKNILAHKI